MWVHWIFMKFYSLYSPRLQIVIIKSVLFTIVAENCYFSVLTLFLTRNSGFLEHFQPITNLHNTKHLNFCTIKMPKNPFVNCKSRKRRKIRGPVPRPQEKLFCPRTMVRYDNSPSEYSTLWACKMCLKCLLNEDAVRNHLINCNDLTKKITSNPPTKKKDDIQHYVCDTCNKVFSRHVVLKKHLELHEKASNGLELEQSDNVIMIWPIWAKMLRLIELIF